MGAEISKVYQDCLLLVQVHELTDYLYLVGMTDYELILGTNWLCTCQARIDCAKREGQYDYIKRSKSDDTIGRASSRTKSVIEGLFSEQESFGLLLNFRIDRVEWGNKRKGTSCG